MLASLLLLKSPLLKAPTVAGVSAVARVPAVPRIHTVVYVPFVADVPSIAGPPSSVAYDLACRHLVLLPALLILLYCTFSDILAVYCVSVTTGIPPLQILRSSLLLLVSLHTYINLLQIAIVCT